MSAQVVFGHQRLSEEVLCYTLYLPFLYYFSQAIEKVGTPLGSSRHIISVEIRRDNI